MAKLRRTFSIQSESGRGNTNILQTILLKVSQIDERTKRQEEREKEREVQSTLERFNISPYFPATSLTIIEDFMGNKEGNFKLKKEEFETYLYSVCTLDYNMDNFCSKLLNALFRKFFIRDHRWPSTE